MSEDYNAVVGKDAQHQSNIRVVLFELHQILTRPRI